MTERSFYVAADSPLHRLDPRPKLLLLVAALFLAVADTGTLLPASLFVLGCILIHLAGAWRPLRRVWGLIVTLFLFSVVVWSLLPLLGGRSGGAGAALVGMTTGLRLAAMVLWSVLFLATTRAELLTLGLVRLGLPYTAAFAFSTALRLVPALVGAAVTIIEAQKTRGLDVETGSWLQRARRHVPLLVPIIASTLRSTNTYAMALEARGFRARPGRTSLIHLRMTLSDWAICALATATMAFALWLRWRGA
jgi:energy-coupling factor transport system permease protein